MIFNVLDGLARMAGKSSHTTKDVDLQWFADHG